MTPAEKTELEARRAAAKLAENQPFDGLDQCELLEMFELIVQRRLIASLAGGPEAYWLLIKKEIESSRDFDLSDDNEDPKADQS